MESTFKIVIDPPIREGGIQNKGDQKVCMHTRLMRLLPEAFLWLVPPSEVRWLMNRALSVIAPKDDCLLVESWSAK